MNKLFFIVVVFLIFLSSIGWAAIDRYPFQSAEQRKTFLELTQDFRCLVCQNETLASSTSHFAADMRDEIYYMLQTGKTQQSIKDYMIMRYGQFVSFKPLWNRETYVLWCLPLLLFFFALALGYFVYRKYRAT